MDDGLIQLIDNVRSNFEHKNVQLTGIRNLIIIINTRIYEEFKDNIVDVVQAPVFVIDDKPDSKVYSILSKKFKAEYCLSITEQETAQIHNKDDFIDYCSVELIKELKEFLKDQKFYSYMLCDFLITVDESTFQPKISFFTRYAEV